MGDHVEMETEFVQVGDNGLGLELVIVRDRDSSGIDEVSREGGLLKVGKGAWGRKDCEAGV